MTEPKPEPISPFGHNETVTIKNFIGWDNLFQDRYGRSTPTITIRASLVIIIYEEVTLAVDLTHIHSALRYGQEIYKVEILPIQGFVDIYVTATSRIISLRITQMMVNKMIKAPVTQ